MTVIATDFVPTTPYVTDVVTLGVGQRTDVLVTAGNYPGQSFWMRTRLPGGPQAGGSTNPEALAAIYYEGADPSVEPSTWSYINAKLKVEWFQNLATSSSKCTGDHSSYGTSQSRSTAR